MRIAIYTANVYEKDAVKIPLNYRKINDVDYFLFTDVLNNQVTLPYKSIIINLDHDDITKNARQIKILGHEILNTYDILIWHDANIQLNINYLDDLIRNSKANETFLTTFSHPHRDDFYSEAMTCVRASKDDHFKILKQVIYSFLKGMPMRNGLCATGILIKNNSYCSNNFLEFWWNNTLRFSRRDQLSLAYSLYKTNTKIGLINDDIFNNKYSKYHNHLHNEYLIKNRSETKSIFKMLSFYFIKVLRKIKKIK